MKRRFGCVKWMTMKVNRKSFQCETATSTTDRQSSSSALSLEWPCHDW